MNDQSTKAEVREFVARENFHAAYNIALSAMNACVRNQDQGGVDRYLELIQDIVDHLQQRYGSTRSGSG